MGKILVVEDDPVIRAAYKEVLQSEGHQVFEAENGQKALTSVAKISPDLILLDILLPEMSGLEFLRHYRKETPNPAEVLVLTNVDHPETAREAKDLGARDYLRKSDYSMRQLAEVIDQFLRGSDPPK